MLRLIYLLVALPGAVLAATQSHVYFMPPVETHNNQPTTIGQQRMVALQHYLADKHIQAVYVDDSAAAEYTAKNIAKQAGLSIISFHSTELETLASMLKKRGENALVVGDRQALPLLIHLAGGEAQSLSEERFGTIIDVHYTGSSVETGRYMLPPQPDLTAKPLRLRAAPAVLGRHRFRVLVKGQELGYMIQDVQASPQQLEFTEITQLDSMNIHTITKAWVDSMTFKPIQVRMIGTEHKPLDVHLQFADNHVTGHSDVERPAYFSQQTLQLDRWLPALSYEKSSVMIGLPMVDYQQSPVNFNWINPKTGEVRLISLIKTAEQQVTVPAGTFDTDVVHLVGTVPARVFYISRSNPQIIKMVIPSRDWSLEKVN